MAQIDGTTIADHPQVLAAAAAVRNAALALHRTELASPVSGVVAKRTVQVGQRVAAGTPLLGRGAARRCVGRRQFQGSAARSACASASR